MNDSDELEGVHPIVALGLAAVSRVGCRSPACGVVCDSVLFRCVAELAVERRPVVTYSSEIFCLSTYPSRPHVRLGKPDLESCADGYVVGDGWRDKNSEAWPLGYRGLRFWALVGVFYREMGDGEHWLRPVPQSSLFALVSWNTVNGDVVSKTLLLRGREAYQNRWAPCAAAWDWPIVAFVSYEHDIYVVSAETGEILLKFPTERGLRALLLGDIKSDNGQVKKCVGIAEFRQLEWRPLADVAHVLRSVQVGDSLYFAHPQALLYEDNGSLVLYDVRSGQKLAQCTSASSSPRVFFTMSRLWTLDDLVQLVEKNLDFSLVEFEAGFHLQSRSESAVRVIPNGSKCLQNKNRLFKRDGLSVF